MENDTPHHIDLPHCSVRKAIIPPPSCEVAVPWASPTAVTASSSKSHGIATYHID
ncbi:hypothetical protein L484_026023 [Morus notabilis]|uniref:Uncharacterized protein n=1 Tax=Morus notabilis TaxID=981085 RepID=W9R7M0_9ROSA|nr:hypothetical protein L484_026023 [Morus notabilis]